MSSEKDPKEKNCLSIVITMEGTDTIKSDPGTVQTILFSLPHTAKK